MKSKKRKWLKIVSIFLLMLFAFTNFNTGNIINAAENDMNIISETNIDVNQVKEWMKKNNATDTFVGLADLYYKYCKDHGGVNPVIAYLQAAKETGYGKFTGVLKEEYCNPCGLKTSAGGGDYDIDAHQKFNNWDEGVQAHLDHLALYAGAAGYPRTNNTYDPRHFASILGKAPTVVSLGGKWAGSSTYGTEIISMYNKLVEFIDNNKNDLEDNNGNVSEDLPMVGEIDSPEEENEEILSDKILIEGWALNKSGVKEVKVYLDDEFISNAKIGLAREDIQTAYPKYDNSINSGYECEVDLSKYPNGNKTIKIDAIGNDGTIFSKTRIININRIQSIGCLDNVQITDNKINLSGWAISSTQLELSKIYIDNQYYTSVVPSGTNEIVKKNYSNYPYIDKCVYSAQIDVSDLLSGNKKIKVENIFADGSVEEEYKYIDIKTEQPGFRSFVEGIKENDVIYTDKVSINGWALSKTGVSRVNVYGNNTLLSIFEVNKERKDIMEMYSAYDSSNLAGFAGNIDLSKLTNGKVELKFEYISKDGSSNVQLMNITYNKLDSIGQIETPTNGQTVVGKTLDVTGWSLSSTGVKEVKIYVDNVLKATTTADKEKNNMDNKYSNYPNYNKSGYEVKVDISDMSGGEKVVKTEEISNDGSVITNTVKININRREPAIAIDTPYSDTVVNENLITITGWTINENGTKEVKVYVDDIFRSNAEFGLIRSDVGRDFSDFLYSLNSGYSCTLDFDKIGTGRHEIRVDAIGKDGKKVSVYRTFYYKNYGLLVVIDAGHGGTDPGALSSFGGRNYIEKDLNKEIAYKTKKLLEQAGCRVEMARSNDDTVSLQQRASFANSVNADLFISIHQNSFSSESAHGTEVYYTSKYPDAGYPAQDRDNKMNKSKTLAGVISGNIASGVGFTNRGAKDGNLFVLRNTKMPAILVECGFQSNYSNVIKLSDGSAQEEIARQIVNGVRAVYK